ncbi:drug/metabolite transporter (DMT)-like permease [Allocatelliglobosispora scoriae]|uniref:Drug/metabolite transporter (DMT)-like permease n=1 Tax=Allocatelliglobosispora scoriae TaxID=643052 RepID=A0A841BJC1_9ACTN|nr:DMT family transporter [Allocatelliglobosispora scoriae]MBB5866920.1 drug/metabolite transporter (DMT)-like permease [Allocatelliglobosispora scoriae]
MTTQLALVLSLASAIGYAGAAVTQQRLAARLDAPLGWFAALGYPSWWAATLLNLAAAALHVAALRFGPLTLVQPLGMLTLVLAMPLGAAVARRRVTGAQWRGAGAAIAGLAGLVVLTSSSAALRPLTVGEAITATAVTGLVIAGLVVLAIRSANPATRSLSYAAGSGIAFGISSALAQTLTIVMTSGGIGANAAVMLAIAALVAAAALLAQASYRYGLAAPLATATLANPVAAAAVGIVVLGERVTGGLAGIPLALAAFGLAAYGVAVLTGHAADSPAHPRPAAPAAARGRAPRPRGVRHVRHRRVRLHREHAAEYAGSSASESAG